MLVRFQPLAPKRGVKMKSNQIVEVLFPSGGRTYSYIGSGNLRVGQEIRNAPVNHYISGKPYTAPVRVVATHRVVDAEIGDRLAVTNGKVHTIRTGLKYLPGAKELQQDRQISINGKPTKLSNYMSNFFNARQRLIEGNQPKDSSQARNRLLGGDDE